MRIHHPLAWRPALILLLSVFLHSFATLSYAQDGNDFGIAPKMKVNKFEISNPMRLDILKIDIKVVGQLAITTFDMTFFNNNSRIMQGELEFPLAEEQTVTRFALDINGAMREGVVVDKEKGRVAFENVVRQGVDPGLLEKTKGNSFKMRIYPLPAYGTRRVVLAFEQELTDKGMYDLYTLPLKLTEPVGTFSIHAEVIKNEVEIDMTKNTLSNLSFDKVNDSYVANLERTDFVPDKRIALAFPHVVAPNASQGKMNANEKVYTAQMNGTKDSSYFYLSLRPEYIREIKALPRQITLIWDNSNSSQEREIEKDLALLNSYIQRIGNLTIDLVTFNIKAAKPERFTITNGHWDKLKNVLSTMVYDGGTDLGCLDFTKYKSDEILLFSDGISTFGTKEPIQSNIPVYTIHSNATVQSSLLTSIAQESGGLCLNLNRFTKDEALKLLTDCNFHFISAKIISGSVGNLYPSKACSFNKTFSMAGIVQGKSASIKLNFGIGNSITYSKVVQIEGNNAVEKDLLRRIWAEKKIAELNLNETRNKEEITLVGKQFGIVTPGTSLIVLENLSDYIRNNIVPPVEMQGAYFNSKNNKQKEELVKTQNHIDEIVAESADQSKWWNTNYPLEPRKPIKNLPMRSTISIANVQSMDEERSVDIVELRDHQVIVEDVKVQEVERKAEIQLNEWDPQTPYAKVLEYASKGEEFPIYLRLKKEYGTTPSFYMDAADFFIKSGKKDTALVILSNLAELNSESPQLLRVLGYKLRDLKLYEQAIMIFKEVLKLRGEEPQSYRDLGLALKSNGDYQEAINTLYKVVETDWNGRFDGIELIAMNEINSIITAQPGLDYSFVDKRLIKKEPVDIRVLLSWDTDACDMDLWVTDPEGEKCFYSNKGTRLGGRISNDFTDGYGPEEFMLKKAVDGFYVVESNYFGNGSQAMLTPISLHLIFITDFGKPTQKEKEVTIRLDTEKDIINVGKFKFTRLLRVR